MCARAERTRPKSPPTTRRPRPRLAGSTELPSPEPSSPPSATRDAANTAYANAASTSLLLLDLQAWLDDHYIKVDIHQGFGQVTRQLSNQTASIVNNSIGIVLAAGTLFVNGILVLIISIYFVSDGPRLVRACRNIGPPAFRQHIPFYLASLDRSLSGYVRGQILLAAAAGVLGAGGALRSACRMPC